MSRIFSRKYIIKLPKPKLLYEMGLISLSRVRQDRLTGTVSLSQADQWTEAINYQLINQTNWLKRTDLSQTSSFFSLN